MKDIPILNVYYLLCYAWGHAQTLDTERLAPLPTDSTVQDLLGKVLAVGVNHLVRRGIDRGYVEKREDLAGIRGKLAISETAKRALRARSRAACDFEELAIDILPNRILRTSLYTLLSPQITLNKTIRGEVRSAYRRLDGISRIRLTKNTFGQIQLAGNRRLYLLLLTFCRLLYENTLVNEKTGNIIFHDFRQSEATMWKLFEEFVTEFYRCEQKEYRVNPQKRSIKWTGTDGTTGDNLRLLPSMEADLILESPGRRIILDTKFYTNTLGGRTSGKLHSNNLYQLLAYLRNRQSARPTGVKHDGILLYPQVGSTPLRADIRLEGFRIQARTVNLNQCWRCIHKEMLNTICLS